MTDFVIGAIVLIGIVIVSIIGRKQRIRAVEVSKSENVAQKRAWENESFATAEAVQSMRNRLVTAVEQYIKEDELGDQLKAIIRDWAELKIQSFQERRSWIRKTE